MPVAVTVLDASALLAYLQDEPGAAVVGEGLDGALLSSVNFSEVLQKAAQFGADTTDLADDLVELGLRIEPFSVRQAELAAELWPITRAWGLSFADRACLAIAIDHKARVLTADRDWAQLSLPLAIRVIR